MIPLLKSQHVLVDLAVSEEVQSLCFFAGHAKALMRKLPIWMDAETADFFQWLYLKWSGSHRRGIATFADPETGETGQMTKAEADAKGWVGYSSGKGIYKDPETGVVAQLTKAEAEKLGWVGATAGNKRELIDCPHCGKRSTSVHLNQCPENEGSWGWFKEQMKIADPTWRKTPGGNWRRQIKPKPIEVCPHCDHECRGSQHQWHFDNCVKKEGSWRWFVEQTKVADPTWRKTPSGNWVRTKAWKKKERSKELDLRPIHIEHLNGGGKMRRMSSAEGKAAGWILYEHGRCHAKARHA